MGELRNNLIKIALEHGIRPRGLHPLEIIAKLKTEELKKQAKDTLREICKVGFNADYDRIKPIQKKI